MALCLQIEPLTLNIILGQVVKPFIEKLAESFSTSLQGLVWRKGYCPFCGSFPELSVLKGAEGQRWLRCALCGHEWRFMKMVCPFCENSDHERMGFSYIPDRPYEGVEICARCRRYLLGIDLRRGGEDGVLDTVATGLLRMEILAQEAGFLPMALYPWNFAVQNNISTKICFHRADLS
jgi:FdhE protein